MSLNLKEILISQTRGNFLIWCPIRSMEVMKKITKFQLNVSKIRPKNPQGHSVNTTRNLLLSGIFVL